MMINYIETECDIIDETKVPKDMEELEARFEELEEWSEENNVEDTGDNADMNESNGDEV